MTNPQIPPSTPPQLVLSTQKSAPLPATGPVVATRAVVKEVPDNLKNKQSHIEGRVVSSNPQTKEVRIATKEGEIVVQSDVPLPPDTEVSVDLYMQNAQMLANIALLKRQDETAAELLKAVTPPATETPPPPPLKEGDTVVVLKLPEEQPPQATPAPVTLEDVAKIIEQIKTEGVEKFPAQLPLPPQIIAEIAVSKDILATLQKLSPEQQVKIIAFVQQPVVMEYLKNTLDVNIPSNIVTPPKGESDAEIIDNNILNIVRAQISAKMTQAALQENTPPNTTSPHVTPAATPPTLAVLAKILPLIENLESITEPIPAYIRQFISPQVMAHFQKNDATLHQGFFQFRVTKIFPPNTPAAKLPLMQAPTPMTPHPPQLGTIEAITPSGFPVIKAENNGITAHFVIRTPVTILVGSTIVFEPQSMTHEQIISQIVPSATPIPHTQAFDPLTSAFWPAIQEAMQAVAQGPQNAMAATLRNTLPTPSPHFTPTALFFLAALRMGTVENWLGPNILQTLKDIGKKDLVEKLGGDFAKISAQSKETVSGDWKMISMPLLHDENLSQLQFYIRKQQDNENKDDGDAKPVTRFLLNLNLSRMGDMQLDGLLRKKQFDLILRSEEALPFEMRQDLMQAFAKGLSQADMQGGIGFQVKQDHWVSVEMPKHQGTVA